MVKSFVRGVHDPHYVQNFKKLCFFAEISLLPTLRHGLVWGESRRWKFLSLSKMFPQRKWPRICSQDYIKKSWLLKGNWTSVQVPGTSQCGHSCGSFAGKKNLIKHLGWDSPSSTVTVFYGIRWPLFFYLHHNSKSLIIIFVHWMPLLEHRSHETN